MINFYKRPIMLLAGIMAIFTTGCITGTHTFSNAAISTTRFCSIDNAPAPVFDIPSAVENFPALSAAETSCVNDRKVSLKP